MSFVFRPLMAAAAIALATPAFAQTGTVSATTPTAPTVTAPATQPAAKTTADVKTPDVKAADKTTVDTKSDAMVKSDAKADGKDTMKKPETTDKSAVKGKVSAVHHHKTDKAEKTEKTAG